MICKICSRNIGNKGISYHIQKIHNMSNREYYDKYLKNNKDDICKICGKPTKFFGVVRGYGTYCGNSCAQLDPETRQKYKDVCKKKYGAENVFASDYGKQKIKETCLKKYGVEYAFQSNEVRDKIKQTCIDKYGVENPQQNKEIKNKTSKTNIERYGNAGAMHNPELWKKAVATMKKNGNYSSLEDYLEQFFNKNHINYATQYKEKRYPFFCDFYLPDTDTFIEINGYWHHNGHYYDGRRNVDKETLKKWKKKAKTKPQYKVAIEVWTIRDIKKKKYAKRNKLNYIVLWNKNDIDSFIQNFTY